MNLFQAPQLKRDPLRQRTEAYPIAMLLSLIGSVTVATALLSFPSPAFAQGASKLLADARVQLADRRLDSAMILLHAVTDNHGADSSQRSEAFLWLGVVMFYKNQDTAVTNA